MTEKWYERFWPVMIVLTLASFSLLTIYWLFQEFGQQNIAHSLPVFLAKEAGMAGLIALILNLSIEWTNRARHAAHQDNLLGKLDKKYQSTSKHLLQNVNKRIFKTLYKRNIDPDVFSQVDVHLLKAKTMRRDYIATVTLTPLIRENGEPPKFARMNFENTFRICNLTNKSVTEPVVKALVERIPPYQDDCRFVRVSIGERKYTSDELGKLAEDLADRSLLKLVLQHEISPEDSIPISLELMKVVPINHVEIITTTIPMDQIKLRVVDPSKYFKIGALSMHPEDEKRETEPGEHILTEWSIDKSILPGQGIMIYWHPREECVEALDASSKEPFATNGAAQITELPDMATVEPTGT